MVKQRALVLNADQLRKGKALRWVYPQRQYVDLILDGLKPVDELMQAVLGFVAP